MGWSWKKNSNLSNYVKRYSIFEKSSKFYWSNNRIILPIIFGIIAVSLIRSKVLKIEYNNLDTFSNGLLGGALILGIILKLLHLNKPDPLKGTLNGFLSFEPEQVVAGDKLYKIGHIEKIRITNDDYYGKSTRLVRSFNSGLSNGVDNVCEIILGDGRTVRYNYELYYPNDLQKSKKELIHYYKLGKMDLNNVAEILSLNPSEIMELAAL